jgi:AbrB family looped-hinge helix DNA binding protein
MNQGIMKTVKVSEKGQIAIPSEIQKEYGIKKGDNLMLYAVHGKIMLEKMNKLIKEMTDDFEDMERHTEESLKEFWKNEPEGVWEQYLQKPERERKK